MAISAESTYSNYSRTVYCKVELTVPNRPVLTLTRDDYLISFDILEEATAGDTLFDTLTANTIELSVNNVNGDFNMLQDAGRFAAYLQNNTKLSVFIRTSEDDDWAPFGVFFLDDCKSDALTASIVANDILASVLKRTDIAVPVRHNITVADYWAVIFEALGITEYVIDQRLNTVLSFAYVPQDVAEAMRQLCASYQTFMYVDHSGVVHVQGIATQDSFSLTEADQVTEASMSKLDAGMQDAAQLTYYVPRMTAQQQLASYSNFLVKEPTAVIENIPWTRTPVYRISRVLLTEDKLTSKSYETVTVDGYQGTSSQLTVAVKVNTIAGQYSQHNINIAAFGNVIEADEHVIGTQKTNTCMLSTYYIPNARAAEKLYAIMMNYTKDILKVAAKLRGDPYLAIGMRGTIHSVHPYVSLAGYIMRLAYYYDGGLQCDASIVDKKAFEVMQ